VVTLEHDPFLGFTVWTAGEYWAPSERFANECLTHKISENNSKHARESGFIHCIGKALPLRHNKFEEVAARR
jgi:hypothetical protein